MTPLQQVAAFAVATRDAGMPAALRADAARRVLDVIGNALAARSGPAGRAALAVSDEWGGAGQATVIGVSATHRRPPSSAALVNGTLAHAMDFDDTHLPSVLHPSSSVVPAALAVAEAMGASGAQLLDAVGVGVEVTVRLGMAGYDEDLRNSVFFERGLHATAICGAVGGSVAVAMLRGLSSDGIASAAAVAASMGAGLLEANRTGGTVKPVHCGWAAHSAIAAADLARHGITGPPTVFEGRFGFLQAFCGERAHPERITDRLGTHWELPGIFFKPYPCNHFTHAGADAAIALRRRGLQPDEIADVELGVAAPVLRTIAQPEGEKRQPRSGYAAAFSGPYVVAAALLGGCGLGLGHADFTDLAARDPARLALAAKVRCVADDRCAEIFPRQFPAVLRVRAHDGTLWEERVDVNRGGPGNPLSTEELIGKFRSNALRTLPAAHADAVADQCVRLPALPRVTGLTDLLVPPP